MARYFYYKKRDHSLLIVCEDDAEANLVQLHYICKRDDAPIHLMGDDTYREVAPKDVIEEKEIKFRIVSYGTWKDMIFRGKTEGGVESYRARLDNARNSRRFN